MAADKLRIDIDINSSEAIKELLHVQQWVKQADESAKAMNRTLGEVNASMRSLGAELTKVSAETHKLREANNAAAEKLEDLRSKTGLLTGDIGTLGERIRTISPRWGTMATTAVGAFARISAGVVGATSALAAGAMQLGRMAAEHDRTERAARLLGSAFEQVREATADTVTAQQALALQQGLVQSGLEVTGAQLAQMSQRAREFAQATGGDTEEALGQMLDAMRGLESEGLRRFGVTLNSTGDRQRDFNAAVEQAATAQQRATAEAQKWGTALTGVAAAQQQIGQSLTNQRTMAEDVERTSRAFSQMTTSIGAAIARALDLQNVFTFMATDVIPTLFDRAGSDARNQRAIDASIAARRRAERAQERGTARESLRALQTSGRITAEQFEQYSSALNAGGSREEYIRVEEFARRAGRESAPVAQAMLRDVMDPFVTAANAAREQSDRADQLRRASEEMTRQGERKARKPRGSGDADAAAARTARDAFAAAVAEAMERNSVLVTTDDVPRRPRETVAAYFNRLAELQREFNTMGAVNDLAPTNEAELQTEREKGEAAFAEERAGTDRDRARAQRIAARDRETRRRARTESFGGRVAAGLGFGTDDEGRIAPFNAMTEGATMLTSVVGTLTNGLTSLFDTLVTGSADAGTAFQAFASGLLTELGKMAVQKGLFYTFEGIAALFSAPPAAPLYFAAGAGLLALGAGLGLAGSAIKPQVPAPGAGSDLGAARGLAPRSASLTESSGLGGVTVVMSSLVPAGPADAQRVRDGQRHASRMGFGDRVPRRVEF